MYLSPPPFLQHKGTHVNTAAFEGGRDPFRDAMDTLDDVLQTLGPMPIARAPREDPYASSSDDESATARITHKKRSPSPLTENTKRAAVKKEVSENGGTFTFSVDDELESPPPSDEEEAFVDPLLDFDQQDSSFAFVSGGKRKGSADPKEFTLEDFTSLVQGIAKSTQEKLAAKEKEKAKSSSMKDREREAELEKARVKDKKAKEEVIKEKPGQPKKDPPVLVATEAVFEPSFVKKKHARVAPPPPKKFTPPVSPTTVSESKTTPTSTTMDINQEKKMRRPRETTPKREPASEEKEEERVGHELLNGRDPESEAVEQTDGFPYDTVNDPPYATVQDVVLRADDGTFVAKSDSFDPNYSAIPDLVMMEERLTSSDPPYASILELTAGTSPGTFPVMPPSEHETKSPSPQSDGQDADVDEATPMVVDDHPYSRVKKQSKRHSGKAIQVSAHTQEDHSLVQAEEEKERRQGTVKPVEQDDLPAFAQVDEPMKRDEQTVEHRDDPPYARVKKQKHSDEQPVKSEGGGPQYVRVRKQKEKGVEQSPEQDSGPPSARVKKQKEKGVEQSLEQDSGPPSARVKKQKEKDFEQAVEQSDDPPYTRVKKHRRHSKEKQRRSGPSATSDPPDLVDPGKTSPTQDAPKPHHSGRDRRLDSPSSPSSDQSPERISSKPTSPVRKAPPLPPARKVSHGDDENPYSEISELILPLSQLGIQATSTSGAKDEEPWPQQSRTPSDSPSGEIEGKKQEVPPPVVLGEPEKRKPSLTLPSRQAPAAPKAQETGAKTQSSEQTIAKQPKRFWKRLSVGDKGSKGDSGQVMLKGFQSHADKPPSALSETKQESDDSKAAAMKDTEAPAIPPYMPSSPDSFPLSNRRGYVVQQQGGKGKKSGGTPEVTAQKGGSEKGLTSQQLKAMRRLSIQGQSVSVQVGV